MSKTQTATSPPREGEPAGKKCYNVSAHYTGDWWNEHEQFAHFKSSPDSFFFSLRNLTFSWHFMVALTICIFYSRLAEDKKKF